MAVNVGRITFSIHTAAQRRDVANEALRGLRESIAPAFEQAASNIQADGVSLIPKLRVTMSASLARASGDRLARAIADACVNAAAVRCTDVDAASGNDAYGSRAERIVQLLETEPGVKCQLEDEAAALLIASLNARQTALCRISPFSDSIRRGSGTAFCEICLRLGNARGIIRALGRVWALMLAGKCTDAQALTVLHALTDGEEPASATWAHAARALLVEDESRASTRLVRGLKAAIDGTLAGLPGIAGAVQTLLSAETAQLADAATTKPALASNLTGLWLLLPHITRHIDDVDDRTTRAIAFALAQYLGGAVSESDPAVAALVNDGESPRDLRAAIPRGIRVNRLAVAVVRDFAQALRRFERARCGYILRAILSGPGSVRPVAGGWSASLPHSPLRVVLQRASLIGELNVPWQSPRFFIERDDD
ncbi:MAG: hypothetical protein JO165_06620 [Candidatus Eremiobacteraeota bacterium]|nr:hypothetical protein [Candidatus Eremiobacteraeota bacterium]